MKFKKNITVAMLVAALGISSTACGTAPTTSGSESDSRLELLSEYIQDTQSLAFDNQAWIYDAENDVYYQMGVQYCTNPETTDYETMGIYVPGAYLSATANGDGTYTCTINEVGSIGDYTAATAPIVYPVNTPGYSAQAAPTSYRYDEISSYLESGFIYVTAGMRGKSNGYDASNHLIYSAGAPWGVTDLKAAIRYYRFNEAVLPGNAEAVFTFGMSGGGAQSALMGTTGDSTLYFDYLTSIGSAMMDSEGNYISDAVYGTMSWCPITSLDYANEAYEWNMGQYETSGTRADSTWTSALSDDLSEAYATYINELGLKDEDGNLLTLDQTEDGIYAAGSYYDYLLSEVKASINNFLSDTTFPYTEGNEMKGMGDFGGGMPKGSMPEGNMGGSPDGTSSAESVTYETAEDYIESLNAEGEWVQYDAVTNTAMITTMEDFVTHCKSASKDVAAFDDLSRAQAENFVFGNDESDALHFDSTIATLLSTNESQYAAFSDWDSSIVSEYANDLQLMDKLGNSIAARVNMYNPMYYLSDYYEGNGTSTVAPYWRIRTGIEQGDTALTVETNLALALEQLDNVKSVDFEMVWGEGHTQAERAGDSTTNFIEWVNECMNQ